MSDYTKGEWKVIKGDGKWWWIDSWKDGNYGGMIANIGDDDPITTLEVIANAYLMAASPRMYKALKAFLAIEYPPDIGDWLTEAFPEAHEMAQEALAKAEGK